jgi:hypothetical protein
MPGETVYLKAACMVSVSVSSGNDAQYVDARKPLGVATRTSLSWSMALCIALLTQLEKSMSYWKCSGS